MSRERAVPGIDISADGLRIDGDIVDPFTIERLESEFGAPRRHVMDPGGTSSVVWVVWDDLGLRTSTKEGEPVTGIDVTLVSDRQDEEPKPWFPTATLQGPVTINGGPPIDAVPVDQLRKAYALIELRFGDWEVMLILNDQELGSLGEMEFKERFAKSQTDELADMVRGAKQPFSQIVVSYSPKVPVAKPSGRWKLPVVTEPVLEFRSFPFRLAVIEELMFNQGVLEPRFDVHHFSQDRGAKNFDPDEYMEEMIPSVRLWFRKYPIPERLAEQVRELVLDGGNDIYLQLIPQWDGEDDQFSIPSLSDADLAPFTNLKRVQDIGGFLGPRARKALEKRGVEIE